MVESTALEMRHTGNRIGGSNPSLSANTTRHHSDFIIEFLLHCAATPTFCADSREQPRMFRLTSDDPEIRMTDDAAPLPQCPANAGIDEVLTDFGGDHRKASRLY